jgi:hypothetical protein
MPRKQPVLTANFACRASPIFELLHFRVKIISAQTRLTLFCAQRGASAEVFHSNKIKLSASLNYHYNFLG